MPLHAVGMAGTNPVRVPVFGMFGESEILCDWKMGFSRWWDGTDRAPPRPG